MSVLATLDDWGSGVPGWHNLENNNGNFLDTGGDRRNDEVISVAENEAEDEESDESEKFEDDNEESDEEDEEDGHDENDEMEEEEDDAGEEDSSEDDDQQSSRKKAKKVTAKVPNHASGLSAASMASANLPHAKSLSAATTPSAAGLALFDFHSIHTQQP